MRVIGYLRVSTDRQANEGHGLDAQRDAIQRRADERGWTVQWVEDAGISGGKTERPGLNYALHLLASHQADGLVVSKLDRLARSVLHFADLVEQARKEGWNLVLLDMDLDLSTPHGKLVANILASIAEFERQIISQRTKDALKAAADKGIKPGPARRPVDPLTAERLQALQGNGLPLAEIAHTLTLEGHALPSGKAGCWTSTQVQRSITRLQEAGAEA